MNEGRALLERLELCVPGRSGWRDFEDVCLKMLQFLFVPPLERPIIQARTHSGIDRRDAVFPNRNMDIYSHWGRLYRELDARMILVEFKNHDRRGIGKEETNQTRNYMRPAMGRLAIMCCNQTPTRAAHIQRNEIYHDEPRRVILFVTKEHLREMVFIKERGEDPADLIMDMVERFYVEHG